MGETHAGAVRCQAVGQRRPPGAAFERRGQPGRGVDLVGRDRRGRRLRRGPALHPGGIGPTPLGRRRDDGAGTRRQFGRPSDRVGLLRQHLAARAEQLVLVDRPGADAWDKQVPNADVHVPAHRVAAPVPEVEVAHHRNAAGIRRPNGEPHAGHAVHFRRVRAEGVAEFPMPTLAQQVQVERPERRGEGVGVSRPVRPERRVKPQVVRHALRDGAGPEPVGMEELEGAEDLAVAAADRHGAAGARQERPDAAPVRAVMRAEHRKRVAVPALHDGFNRACIRHGHAVASKDSRRSAMRYRPPSGMPIQVGRFAASYLIS